MSVRVHDNRKNDERQSPQPIRTPGQCAASGYEPVTALWTFRPRSGRRRRLHDRSLTHFGFDLLNCLCAADADFHLVCLEAGNDTPAAGRDAWAEPLGVGLAVRKETCRLGRQRRPRERYKHERHQRREPELSKNHDYPPVFPRHPSDGRRPANKFAPSCSPPHLGNNPRPPTRLLNNRKS
jgi:hypothetical protein